jgi:hypothetical protein
MRTGLLLAALAVAACKPAKPMVEVPVPAAQAPALDGNAAERYVGGLQSDVKRAQEAKAKADAANAQAEEVGR